MNIGRMVRNVISSPSKSIFKPVSEGLNNLTGSNIFATPEETANQLNEEGKETVASIPPPDLSAGEVDPEGNLGPVHDPRKAKYGRTAANLNPGAGASILTS